MDHFGIGNAFIAAMHAYINAARRTGRTTSLVESVKDGDRIVFLNHKEASRVQRLCLMRNVTVKCIVVPFDRLDILFNSPPSLGRTIFDHTWVEEFYLAQLKNTAEDIDMWQRRVSGTGTDNEEEITRTPDPWQDD